MTRFYCCLFLCLASSLFADPNHRLRYEVDTCQAELHMLTERIATQEELIDSLQESVEALKKEKLLHAKQEKMGKENESKEVLQLKETLQSFRDVLSTFEVELKNQKKAVKGLQGGMTALLQALGQDVALDTSLQEDGKGYRVQPGDSLGKIALQHKTTVQALKEANQLKKDTIYVGQHLVIP